MTRRLPPNEHGTLQYDVRFEPEGVSSTRHLARKVHDFFVFDYNQKLQESGLAECFEHTITDHHLLFARGHNKDCWPGGTPERKSEPRIRASGGPGSRHGRRRPERQR
ncbi:unnamed protein product [Symbiodinium sp. CCMP2592]|nr:unnamed protein product [Symbiodinium sp. CCMP2592]